MPENYPLMMHEKEERIRIFESFHSSESALMSRSSSNFFSATNSNHSNMSGFTRLYLGRLAPEARREDIEDFFKGYGVSSSANQYALASQDWQAGRCIQPVIPLELPLCSLRADSIQPSLSLFPQSSFIDSVSTMSVS